MNPRLHDQLRPLLVLLLLGLGLSACSQDRAISVASMNKGIEAYQRGDSSGAVKHLKDSVQADPTYAEPAYILAQVYEDRYEELDNAELYYRQAVERDKDKTDSKYNYKLGVVLAKKGDHGAAMGAFDAALQIDPKDAKAAFRAGESHLAQREYAEAVEDYMTSINSEARMRISDDSKGGEAYHALGDLYNRFGFFDKALKVYENGTTNNPDAKYLYQGKGVAELGLKRYDQAVISFKKALELDPTYTTAQFNMGVAFKEMGNSDEAVKTFKQFMQSAKDQARISAANGLIDEIEMAKEKALEKAKEKKK